MEYSTTLTKLNFAWECMWRNEAYLNTFMQQYFNFDVETWVPNQTSSYFVRFDVHNQFGLP
jgi:hypothetical protein